MLREYLEKVKDYVSRKLKIKRVIKVLKIFNSHNKLSELHDILILNDINDEAIKKSCMGLNHSINRILSSLGSNDYSMISMKIFLDKELDLSEKYLKEIRARYTKKFEINKN